MGRLRGQYDSPTGPTEVEDVRRVAQPPMCWMTSMAVTWNACMSAVTRTSPSYATPEPPTLSSPLVPRAFRSRYRGLTGGTSPDGALACTFIGRRGGKDQGSSRCNGPSSSLATSTTIGSAPGTRIRIRSTPGATARW